ncbi:MAG: fused MFS/spermidine synthase [Thermodesulfobacteriota bacterium]
MIGLILIYGAGSLVSQVLILRELLVLAQGQELKLALGLWCWLFWTGLGSLLGGRLASRYPPATVQLGTLLFLLAWLLPATILATKALPLLAPRPWGQSLPPGTALLLFLTLLAPFGLVSGFFFPWACRVLAGSTPQGAVGRVYYLEALGAALGVCLLQLLLLGRYSTLALSLGCGLLMALAAWLLAPPRRRVSRLAAAMGLFLLAGAFIFHPQLERLSRGWQWPGRQVLASVDSPYARLTATREGEQVSFFANSLWLFTSPDPLNAEYQTQFALLEHPRPQRVLLLGGGAPGLAPEVLKTATVSHLDYVELDPQLVALGRQVLASPLDDPKVRIIHQDARRYLSTTKDRYDVILMALPEPQNAQLNRYYTREFFAIAARRLEPRGVFSFYLAGSPTSLQPLRAAYLGLAYHTLRQVFPEVLVLPGVRARFFASPTPGTLVADPEVLVSRIAARHLQLDYVREYYLLQDLSRPRQEYLRRVLESQPPEVNTDLNPRCYFYDLALSGVQERLPLQEVLLFLKDRSPAGLWAAIGLATLLLAALLRTRPGPRYFYQVVIMGLGTMTLEIVILIFFQIQLGSLYRQLGLLIAAFMAGMAAGGAWGVRAVKSGAAPGSGGGRARALAILTLLQGGLAALALTLALALPFVIGYSWAGREWALQTGYLVLLALAGGLGGAVFAGSAALWVQTRPDAGTRGGVLYAADLLGATVGSLGISLVVLPVWGLAPTLYLVAALHAGAALMLAGSRV